MFASQLFHPSRPRSSLRRHVGAQVAIECVALQYSHFDGVVPIDSSNYGLSRAEPSPAGGLKHSVRGSSDQW